MLQYFLDYLYFDTEEYKNHLWNKLVEQYILCQVCNLQLCNNKENLQHILKE